MNRSHQYICTIAAVLFGLQETPYIYSINWNYSPKTGKTIIYMIYKYINAYTILFCYRSELSYVCLLVCRSVIISSKGREVALPCFYRVTSYTYRYTEPCCLKCNEYGTHCSRQRTILLHCPSDRKSKHIP